MRNGSVTLHPLWQMSWGFWEIVCILVFLKSTCVQWDYCPSACYCLLSWISFVRHSSVVVSYPDIMFTIQLRLDPTLSLIGHTDKLWCVCMYLERVFLVQWYVCLCVRVCVCVCVYGVCVSEGEEEEREAQRQRIPFRRGNLWITGILGSV